MILTWWEGARGSRWKDGVGDLTGCGILRFDARPCKHVEVQCQMRRCALNEFSCQPGLDPIKRLNKEAMHRKPAGLTENNILAFIPYSWPPCTPLNRFNHKSPSEHQIHSLNSFSDSWYDQRGLKFVCLGVPAKHWCTTLGIHFGDLTGFGWEANKAISMSAVRHIWDTCLSCRAERLAEEGEPRDRWGLN